LNEEKRMRKAITDWDLSVFPVVAGECADLIKNVKSAKDIVVGTAEDAIKILRNTSKLIS